ncbi:hypothetical protein FVEN_g594 [Fusarium venenatum]|uniref:Uncharacterized protein n=1 Tax=Fusarium venenatum TaxID=56646 RepID=A0A2L2TBV5_9HYPO|nr:uncharacterized protein FVRRES_07267 [Fusarium venenatum]KAG8361937.1 hypothetical protein FVEN_g594 [Fusarium venenatum]CEI62831.1 unnamed protein product [Fusarium venenatum]
MRGVHPYGHARDSPLSQDVIQHALPFRDHRHAGTTITGGDDLTPEELYGLASIMQTTATMGDFERFLFGIFDGWTSASPTPTNPVLHDRSSKKTRLQVGTLSEDHPLTTRQIKANKRQDPERRACSLVYFGLNINHEMGDVDWFWCDSRNVAINPRYVCLDEGQTEITIRTQAMLRYDHAERVRIRTYNCALLEACAKRIVQKWAHACSSFGSVIDDADQPHDLQPLQLAGPYVEAQSEVLAEASRRCMALLQAQHSYA